MLTQDERQSPSSHFLHTGVPGLDPFLGGGFPKNRVIFLLGEPGTGKSTICSQFLYAGALEGDGVSMFIGLNQPKERFVEDMKSFAIDFTKLEAEAKFVYVDAMDQRRGSDLRISDAIRSAIQKYSPKRIVVDSISDLVFPYPDPKDRLPLILDLVEMLQSSGATSVLTIELLSRGSAGAVIQPEEFLADGLIMLRTSETGTRVMQILKMRGVKINPKPKPYDINVNGVEIYGNEEFLP